MNVLLFARARDVAGADRIQIDLPPGGTVADLRMRLASTFPKLASILAHSAIAIGDDYAKDDQVVPPETDAAVIPPVSGG